MLHTIRRNAASEATSAESVGRGSLNPNNITLIKGGNSAGSWAQTLKASNGV